MQLNKILIIDDDLYPLQSHMDLLRSKGYAVETATSGEEGLILAERTRPDLILLDVVLPDADGYEIAGRIRSDPRLLHAYLIMLSAWKTDPESLDRGFETGADDFLKKPISEEELLVRVRAVFRLKQTETAQRRAEEALRESEETLRQLFDNMADGVAIYHAVDDGSDFIFLDINKKGQLLSQLNRNDAVGKRVTEAFPAVGEIGLLEVFRKVWRTGEAEHHPLILYEDERIQQWVENYVFKLPSGQIVALYSDTTEKRRAEEERARLQAQLNQAQKMESVGRLAGGVAHDFNNMLGIILGHTEMALDLVHPAEPLFADLQEIRKAAERSADLTRQLLAFARKQTIAPKVLDMNETVEGMLKMLRRLIGEDIDLAWHPGKNLWPVKMDPSQIDQILANLCVNARDAIVDAGKVTIETANLTLDEAYCKMHAGFVSGEFVLLAVSDSGCGMDKETQDKLFEPFFTTKGVGKGTGLGLATIYGIVKQNRGFINVYSEPGQGTTFKIYVPRHVGKAGWMHEEGRAQATAPGHGTILLVEDETAILHMATRMLQREGYTVLAASTPGEAIRLAEVHPGEIQLLMTDVIMPEMNGRDLARSLLTLYPDLKRLFMSGYTANVIAHHGVLDPGVHFIQKPFSRQDLAEKVREALEG